MYSETGIKLIPLSLCLSIRHETTLGQPPVWFGLYAKPKGSLFQSEIVAGKKECLNDSNMSKFKSMNDCPLALGLTVSRSQNATTLNHSD